MPVGAFGGKKEIMAHISLLGPVYHGWAHCPKSGGDGVRVGDAGYHLGAKGFYNDLFRHTTELCEGMQTVADETGITFTTNHLGSMFGFFFTEDKKVTQYPQVIGANVERFNKFFHLMLNEGVYLAPASFEVGSCRQRTPMVIFQTPSKQRDAHSKRCRRKPMSTPRGPSFTRMRRLAQRRLREL